jgi:alkanesulfonate monooxygenase
MPLKVHWRLIQGGEGTGATRAGQHQRLETALPDQQAQVEFCRSAEQCGIESLLVDFNYGKPDPILLSAVLGAHTSRIKFMIAIRSGLLSPTLFVQQINTISVLTNGRVSLNVVAGHSPQEQKSYGDFLAHDERYARTSEFLDICRSFWKREGEVNYDGRYFTIRGGKLNTPFRSPDRTSPEVFVSGSSDLAAQLALRNGSCWMRVAAENPQRLAPIIRPVLEGGKEVGLRLSVIAGPTREQALRAAYALSRSAGEQDGRAEAEFVKASDSVAIKNAYDSAGSEWLTPWLWTGAVRLYGAPAIALVGCPTDVCEGILEFSRAGISHFILSGWPKRESMQYFGRNVLPLIRNLEPGANTTS